MHIGIFEIFVLPFFVELLLVLTWASWYFRFGIVIFRKVVHAPQARSNPLPTALPRVIENTYMPSLIVHRLNARQFAFREELLHFRTSFTPIMRGLVELDPAAGRVIVTGRIYWSILSLLLFGSAALWKNLGVPGVAFLCILFVLIYYAQSQIYKKLGRTVANIWSEQSEQSD